MNLFCYEKEGRSNWVVFNNIYKMIQVRIQSFYTFNSKEKKITVIKYEMRPTTINLIKTIKDKKKPDF